MDKQQKLKELAEMKKKVKCSNCGKLLNPESLYYSDKCEYCHKHIDEKEISDSL